MLYKILADFIVLIHFFWIVFLFIGALWGARNRVIKVVHLSGLFFAIMIQILGWYCPLTHLEFWLRSKHDSALAYTGSFIVYYMENLVYLEISRTGVLLTTAGLFLFNFWLYVRKR